MRVALIQMDIALGEPAVNRERAAGLIRTAAAGADLVMLPEMWTTGYALPRLAGELADREGEPTGAFLSGLARECRIFLVGSAADLRCGKVYNTATVFGPDGGLLASYSKAHLVPMMDEHLYLTPGPELALAELGPAPAAGVPAPAVGAPAPVTPVKAGLAICYDLRFPELFRSLALAGAHMMLIPAEWPSQRLHHWRTLLMARAIENQCFVVACNRVGTDAANSFPGHSMVIDPWGTVLAEGGEGEEILRAEIDPAQVAEIRARIPVFRDRRPDLYRLT